MEISSGRRASQGTQNNKTDPNQKTIPLRQVHDLTQDDHDDDDAPAESSPLRPTSKGKGRRLSVAGGEQTITESRPRRSRKSGKGASLRLATPNKQPRSISVSDDEDIPIRSNKRRKSLANDGGDDTPLEDPDAEEEADEDEDEEEILEKEAEEEPEEDIDVEEHLRLSLETLKTPSFEPMGPLGLWNCHRKGCKYSLYDVQEDSTQELIRQHFLKHAESIRAQLARFKAVKQESKPHQPLT